jgi:hypothetical protein
MFMNQIYDLIIKPMLIDVSPLVGTNGLLFQTLKEDRI